MESEPMLTPREKFPLPEKFSSEEDRSHNTASSRTASPTHYQWAISPLPPLLQRTNVSITDELTWETGVWSLDLLLSLPKTYHWTTKAILIWEYNITQTISSQDNSTVQRYHLVGLVVKVSVSRVADPGFDSHLRQDFSKSSHTSDLKIGTPVATLPGTWPSRVSAGTGWPGVSILWLGEIKSWICNFYLSVAAHTLVWSGLYLRYTSMLLGH